jgi:hypothetical protein
MQAFIPGATGAEVSIHVNKSVGSSFLSLFGIMTLFVGLLFIVL